MREEDNENEERASAARRRQRRLDEEAELERWQEEEFYRMEMGRQMEMDSQEQREIAQEPISGN